MINFEEELKKFHPSLEVEDAEEAIYNQDLTDMADILVKMISDISMEAYNSQQAAAREAYNRQAAAQREAYSGQPAPQREAYGSQPAVKNEPQPKGEAESKEE